MLGSGIMGMLYSRDQVTYEQRDGLQQATYQLVDLLFSTIMFTEKSILM